MNPTQTGKLISKLRKDAGFTQKSLAEALFVTDKAVSKWERGLSAPDSSLLPKLSMLLDADIELLLAGDPEYTAHTWNGYLESNCLDKIICDKPIIDYLVSYFMLVGIRNIYIKTDDKEFVKKRNLEQYGLKIFFSERNGSSNWMIVNDDRLVFGPNLTRQFQLCMTLNKTVIPSIDGVLLPITFTHKLLPYDKLKKEATIKPLGRGMINLPLDEDASTFVTIYQKHHTKIANLQELSIKRGYVK